MALFNITKRAFARELLAITSGAPVSLTASLYNDVNGSTGRARKASAARIAVKTADLNFTEEGTTPTTTATGIGTPAGDRDLIVLESYEAITRVQFIAQSGVNAAIEVVYYR